MWKIILKYLCKNIIAVSNATKEEIIKKYWKKLENKIVVILNWIDLETFKPYVLKRDLEKAF
jgi:glycosyltransferase involved in cell wall biosynthesis